LGVDKPGQNIVDRPVVGVSLRPVGIDSHVLESEREIVVDVRVHAQERILGVECVTADGGPERDPPRIGNPARVPASTVRNARR
jgi:hypothetical protein